jgi:16S rRNA processing protein RimM
MTSSDENFVAIAEIVKTRGIKGEVVADLLTDFPERFEDTERLIGILPTAADDHLVLILESYWFHEHRVVLKFAGYDSIEKAGSLIGCRLVIPEDECIELEEDEFYDWQLEGCLVETIDNQQVGYVTGVLHTGGVPVLIVHDVSKREYLIPLAEDICTHIDINGKHIRIDPPEGLLEI